jgi:hypothetical protein
MKSLSYLGQELRSQDPSRREILEVLVVGVDCDWMDNSFKKMSSLLERVDNG